MDRKINFLDTSNRTSYKKYISNNFFDVIVIGGGITGSGVCLDASTRGLKTCLIEMNDFASGTSSKSTKLIHGGLRYLEQLKFRLVHETGSERAVLHDIAPHIVKSEKMLLPILRNGKLSKFSTKIALQVYDYLANVKTNDKNKILSKNQTIKLEPLLKHNDLLGGALYSEYRTDDSRLTIDIIKRSYKNGAYPINYIKFKNFLFDEKGIINGVVCEDQLSEENINIFTKKVVNASGSWTDNVINDSNKKLVLSKGIHIVIPQKTFPIKQSLYFDALDSRMIFAIPRGKVVYIGTTDSKFNHGSDSLTVKREEVDYLINSVNTKFSISLKINDVVSSWVGLRPLIKDGEKDVTEISRKDEIFISDNGLITITGGKLTGYRKMAERVVDLVIKKLKNKKIKSITRSLKLFDSDYNFCKIQSRKYGISTDEFSRLYNIYGDGCLEIFKIFNEEANCDEIIIAEFLYCRRREMCLSLKDFFTQRNSVVYFEIDQLEYYLKLLKKYLISHSIINSSEWKLEVKNLKDYVKGITKFN